MSVSYTHLDVYKRQGMICSVQILIKVLLPVPFCPTMPICSPLLSVKPAFLYSTFSPKECVSPSISNKLIFINPFLHILIQKKKAESKDTQVYLPSAFGIVAQKQKAMDKTLSIASYTL